MLERYTNSSAPAQGAAFDLSRYLPPPRAINFTDALWLLSQVMPPDGAGYRGGGSLYHKRGAAKPTIPTRMFSTNATLVQRLVTEGQSRDIWLRTAAYDEWSGEDEVHFAGEVNVLARQCFIVDCDAGPNKPYPDFTAAKAVFRAAYSSLTLPHPIIVCSGGGLHAYWALTAPITGMSLFKDYAAGLAVAFADQGLQFDALCTANPVCFLRLPGTFNFKLKDAPPRPVYLDERGDGPCPLDLFDRFKGLAPPSRAYSRPFLPRKSCADEHPPPAHVVARATARRTDVRSAMARLLVPFKPILRRCAQINDFAKKRGDIAEPVWRLCIGVLPWVQGGEELAHRLSKGDPDYIAADVKAYFDRSDAWEGPTTCDAFRRCGNGLRKTCPHIVYSPVRLAEFE